MSYRTNIDLPVSVRDHLPPHAQDIYRAAFNHAFAAHAGDVRQEEIAHRTAWAAVKRVLRQGWRSLGADRIRMGRGRRLGSGDRSRSPGWKALQNGHDFLIANLPEVTIEIADGPE
jgi:cation transport regulator